MLAEHLHMVRSEMLERMTAEEFYTWAAFLQLQQEERNAPQQRGPSSVKQSPEQMLGFLDKLGAKLNAG